MRRLFISVGLVAVGALGLGSVGCGGTLRAQAGHGTTVAVDPKIEKDIRAGFASYESVLTRWGRWEQDEWYGVRWCPDSKHTPVKFVPYRSRGHWTASVRPINLAPPGSPYWVSDDSDTWGEITMHHGYWVHIDERSPSWCWIPGVEETPGRVVWRSGEGFVGWAPEAPIWVDDGGDGLIAEFAWSFVFLGALLEPDLEPQFLEGESYVAAVASTSPVHSTTNAYAPARPGVADGDRVPANPTVGRAVRVGPPMTRVAEARQVLAGYAITHEGKLPLGGLGGGGDTPKATASSSSSSGTDKGTSSTKKDEKLPNGVVIYSSLSTMPMVGPAGLTPRFYRYETAPYASTIDSEPASPSSSTPSGGSSASSGYSPSSFSSSGPSSGYSSSSSTPHSSSSASSSSSSSHGSSYSPASSSSSHSSSSSSSHSSSFHGGGSKH
jgi:hypothetical protein